ncbi:SPOR domain-containing protein [Halomonas sp. SH5A2]|uniref:SPOR domain-containing protein n=1 Tax=Halomonas sp. SH5A2 TaxID=2749040 RepID=UPI00163DF489|nr:SPOR domain-containing protein [Halomonas sp. SH5A2]QNI03209.1 SPOR domain-containing protein [Halomonas sp. SH5A2]
MKYGKTERISGIVILLALLAIIVPWLMSDPAPREERPQPNFVIEQPVEVERREVDAPQRPDSIGDPAEQVDPGAAVQATDEPLEVDPASPDTDQLTSNDDSASDEAQADESPTTGQSDPIADLIASNSQSVSDTSEEQPADDQTESTSQADPAGEWAVQVGSFGNPDNARRLSEQLSGEGFAVYQRDRDNDMTTVYVGPFATSEEGEAAMSDVKQRANVQGLLVRVRE